MNEQQPTSDHERSPWVQDAHELAAQAARLRLPGDDRPGPADTTDDAPKTSKSDTSEIEARAGPKQHDIGRLAIYAASLTDYNNSVLFGTWVAAVENEEAMTSEIATMLASSPTAKKHGEVAEEWAIHDYEGFEPLRLDEYTGLATIARLAGGIREHGRAFAAWAELNSSTEPEVLNRFEHAFLGRWDSLTDYADNLLDDLGLDDILDTAVPDGLRPYVDVDVGGYARDLEVGGDIASTEADEGGVYLFDMNE